MSGSLPRTTDLAVVGGGILGALTALHVARAGVDVVVVERGTVFGQASGENAGGLAIQTTAPGITPDVVASVAAWSRMSDDLGGDVGFVRTGGFRVASSDDEAALLQAEMPRLAALGLTMRWHDEADLRRGLSCFGPRVVGASYCAEEGYALPGLAGAAVRRAVQAAGGRVVEHTAVTGLHPEGQQMRVTTGEGDLLASRVLIAGGAWIATLARMLGVEIPIVLKTFILTATERTAPLIGQLVTHAQRNLTLKQLGDGTCLIGGGWPGRGGLAPLTKEVDADSLAGNLRHAESVIPGLAGVPVQRSWAGLEGATPDELPLMGSLSRHRNVFVLGCVRGGFVLGPQLTPLMADLVLGRTDGRPAFDPGRFDTRPGAEPSHAERALPS